MLSDQARSDANPILLIDENDVTAGHAASIGQVDPEDMYYLMSRGLDKATAERLVVRGFLGSVIVEIPVKEVRDEMIRNYRRKNCQNAKGQPMLDVEAISQGFSNFRPDC